MEVLTRLFNTILETGRMLSKWRQSEFLEPIFKNKRDVHSKLIQEDKVDKTRGETHSTSDWLLPLFGLPVHTAEADG